MIEKISKTIRHKVPNNNSYYELNEDGYFDCYLENINDSNQYAGISVTPQLFDIYLSPTSDLSFSGLSEQSDMNFVQNVLIENTSGKVQKIPYSQVARTITSVSNNEDSASPDGSGGWGVPSTLKIIVPPKTIIKFDFFARFNGATTDYRFTTKFSLTTGVTSDAQENVIMELTQEDFTTIRRTVFNDGLYNDLSWDTISGFTSDNQKILTMTGTIINYSIGTTHEWQFEYRTYDGYLGQKYTLSNGASLTYQQIGTVV